MTEEQEKEAKRFLEYIRDTSNEFWEMVSHIFKKQSNLPANIYIDDYDRWIDLCGKKIILFQTNNNYDTDYSKMIPMSIEKNPEILVKDEKIDLTPSEIVEIKRFVSECKKPLVQIGKGKIDYEDFYDILREKGFYKKRKKSKFIFDDFFDENFEIKEN